MEDTNMVTADNKNLPTDGLGDYAEFSQHVNDDLRDEKTLKKELTAKRIVRGRLRGKLRDIQESMSNILCDDDDDKPKELEALEIQESLIEDQLQRAENDIAELEEERLVGFRTQAQKEARSRASGSMASGMKPFLSISTATIKSDNDCKPAVTETAAHQGTSEINDEQNAKLPVHQQPLQGGTVRTVRCQATIRSLESELMQSEKTKNQEVRNRGEGVSAELVSNLVLPKCRSVVGLRSHLQVCEAILVESGAGEFTRDGTFCPITRLKITVVERLIDTLGDSEETRALSDSARDAVVSSKWDWRTIRNHLLNRFARKSTLAAKITHDLAALKYTGPRDIDRFLEASERVYRLAEAISSDPGEHRRIVKRIVNLLPEKDREAIIKETKRVYREITGSYSSATDKDWATMFPSTNRIVTTRDFEEEEITLMDIIRDQCRTQESAGIGKDSDKVYQVADPVGGRSQTHKEQHNKGSLEEWAKQFASVWVVTMRSFKEETVKAVFSPDDMKKVGMRPKGTARRFYGIIAYKDGDRGQKVVKEVLKANEGTDLFRAREFVYRGSGNGQGRVQH